jgi:hypothetical protein
MSAMITLKTADLTFIETFSPNSFRVAPHRRADVPYRPIEEV